MIEWPTNILLFREKSAQESLDFVKQIDWDFYRSLITYVASFYTEHCVTARNTVTSVTACLVHHFTNEAADETDDSGRQNTICLTSDLPS